MNPPKTITKRLRRDVWEKYYQKEENKGKCQLCKDVLLFKNYECGHIISKKNGGLNTIDNLKPLCGSCNKKMGHIDFDIYENRFTTKVKEYEEQKAKNNKKKVVAKKVIEKDTIKGGDDKKIIDNFTPVILPDKIDNMEGIEKFCYDFDIKNIYPFKDMERFGGYMYMIKRREITKNNEIHIKYFDELFKNNEGLKDKLKKYKESNVFARIICDVNNPYDIYYDEYHSWDMCRPSKHKDLETIIRRNGMGY